MLLLVDVQLNLMVISLNYHSVYFGKVELLIHFVAVIPINYFSQETSGLIFDFVLNIAERVIRKCFLWSLVLGFQTISLAARTNKQHILNNKQPKFVPQNVLMVIF